MYNQLQHINMKNKKRYIITGNESFDSAIDKLRQLNPMFTSSILIRLCVQKAAEEDMVVSLAGIGAGNRRKHKNAPKEVWCESVGGEVKDGVCYFDRYEELIDGKVMKAPRVLALTAMPLEREDFHKIALTSFASFEQAEAAYQANPYK